MVEFIYKYPVVEINWREVKLWSEPVPIERKEFYKEEIERHLKWMPPQFAVEIVNILLCDPTSKQFLIQKRSHGKWHNAWLYDKTIWGHLQALPNNTSMETAQFETLEELKIPSYAFNNDDSFHRAYEKFSHLLGNVAIIKQIDTKPLIYKRIMEIQGKKEYIDIASKVHVFFGTYEWSIKNNDGEAAGFSFMQLDTLKNDIEKYPDMYTNDLTMLIAQYGDRLINEIKQLPEIKSRKISK